MKDKIFSIRFDKETFNLLGEIAEKNKITRSSYIRKLLSSSMKSESTIYIIGTQEFRTKKKGNLEGKEK